MAKPTDPIAAHLTRVRRALRRRGIPRHVAERLVDELRQHAHDVLENIEHSDHPDARRAAAHTLGDPQTLAAEALARLPLAARFPLVVFVLGPIAALPLLAVGYGWLASLLFDASLLLVSDKSSVLSHGLILSLLYLGMYGIPMSITGGLIRFAWRQGFALAWSLFPAGLFYLVYLFFRVSYTLPTTPRGHGSVSVGFMPCDIPSAAAVAHASVALLPPAVALVFMWLRQKNRTAPLAA